MIMEYFWYIVAAIGAGVGTGLAGLSAATVMVPSWPRLRKRSQKTDTIPYPFPAPPLW